MTTRELEEAVAAIAQDLPRPTREPPLPRGAAPKLRALETHLSKGTPWTLGRPRVSTRVAKDPRGRAHALVTIHDVPIADLPRLARALAR